MRFLGIFCVFSLLLINNANAVLKIDITQGNVEPVPVAINNFLDMNGQENALGTQVREVIENDLKISGLFRAIDQKAFIEKPNIDQKPTFQSWRQIGAMAVSSGRITTVSYTHLDVYKRQCWHLTMVAHYK